MRMTTCNDLQTACDRVVRAAVALAVSAIIVAIVAGAAVALAYRERERPRAEPVAAETKIFEKGEGYENQIG